MAPPPPPVRSLADLAALPARFEAHFDDHFGFRNSLVLAHSIVKTRWLGVSPSDRVVLGSDDWLYYAGERAIELHRRVTPFPPGELEQWVEALERRSTRLQRMGADFLLVVAPEKPTLYPEHLPDHLRPLRAQSRLDELIGALRLHTEVRLVDLRPGLRDAARRHRVYHVTDSHWNAIGAFVAAQAIAEAVSARHPRVVPRDLRDYDIVVEARPGGDLARMIAQGSIRTESEPRLVPRFTPCVREARAPEVTTAALFPGHLRPFATRCRPGDPPLPRALVWHDSFGIRLVPFLSEYFHRAAWVRSPIGAWDPELVEREHPEIVVHEMAERYLMAPPPEN
jgi:alginate O-acetyltransferase complex protein AlgJ